MIFELQEEVPSVEILPCEECTKSGILSAVKDYKALIYGVSTVVRMLDNITEGVYNRSEAIIAGLLLDRGVSGTILEWRCRGVLLRVNGMDLIALEEEVLGNSDFNNESFYPDTGGTYTLKSMDKIIEKRAAARTNNSRPGARGTSSKKSLTV
ncbi:MAG: hypothetical protein HFF84_14615 [Oscillibacter sp.]|nr:hypothetical protein [Oscillibacter sp.]